MSMNLNFFPASFLPAYRYRDVHTSLYSYYMQPQACSSAHEVVISGHSGIRIAIGFEIANKSICENKLYSHSPWT